MLPTADLDYHLPDGIVATVPAEPRDAARLLVIPRHAPNASPDNARDLHIRDLPSLLRQGDLLVVNDTKVVPARLEGFRSDTGGRVEGLFLGTAQEYQAAHEPGELRWVVMLQGKRMKQGIRVTLTRDGADTGMSLDLLNQHAGEPGAWLVRVAGAADRGVSEVLESVGHTPLPPYIRKARRDQGVAPGEVYDRARYQTVFAGPRDDLGTGSVAAPTAGLHLTPQVLAELQARGVETVHVTLHVGSGTFKPVEAQFVELHAIHSERCAMSREAVRRVLETRRAGGRVVAVGTTAVRTLETYAALLEAAGGKVESLPAWADTRLLITPGYQWRWVDGLLTNFHLPRSTLLALVGGLLASSKPADAPGLERLKAYYARAIATGYRFFSYGDAMLILPGEGPNQDPGTG